MSSLIVRAAKITAKNPKWSEWHMKLHVTIECRAFGKSHSPNHTWFYFTTELEILYQKYPWIQLALKYFAWNPIEIEMSHLFYYPFRLRLERAWKLGRSERWLKMEFKSEIVFFSLFVLFTLERQRQHWTLRVWKSRRISIFFLCQRGNEDKKEAFIAIELLSTVIWSILKIYFPVSKNKTTQQQDRCFIWHH